MFCPQCGSNQSDEQKFCNKCGANLYAVRQVVATRETEEKFDWSKTWMAEMFMSKDEQAKRKLEAEKKLGITPESKRAKEVKAGVITSCAGLALMVFLYVFMRGVIVGAHIPDDIAEILGRIWIAGVFPFFVGLGLMINGLLVSKKILGASMQEEPSRANLFNSERANPALKSADTSEFIPTNFSVTEGTTKHLSHSNQPPSDPLDS
ncbi:MAG TPA: zinc-ribbon domain-containing protein [Pyrinomonadaceae bacterium]